MLTKMSESMRLSWRSHNNWRLITKIDFHKLKDKILVIILANIRQIHIYPLPCSHHVASNYKSPIYFQIFLNFIHQLKLKTTNLRVIWTLWNIYVTQNVIIRMQISHHQVFFLTSHCNFFYFLSNFLRWKSIDRIIQTFSIIILARNNFQQEILTLVL